MKNSVKLEDFDKIGVVIVAQSTKTINYFEIAKRAARFIERNLNLPVTIVQPNTNIVNLKKHNKSTEWKNLGRWEVYNQTPYELTILLDADYLALTPTLLKFVNLTKDYQILQKSHTSLGMMESFMGTYYRRHLWATIVMFRQTERSKMLFELVKKIEQNWGYYSRHFQLDPYSFRNDFAFTIADLILNGYKTGINLPHSMLTIVDSIKTVRLTGNLINVKTETQNLVVAPQDLHVMDKEWLLSDDFLNFEKEYNE
jgi:hypothetical protein